MTDLEKAKQFMELYPKEFDEDTLNYRVCHEETVLFKGCWADALMFQEHTADALAAYASHSNSELLERVQKLEQQIKTHEAMYWPPQNEREEHLYEIRNGIKREYVEAHVEELLAKAPETRNV